jgi:hypothetical protein
MTGRAYLASLARSSRSNLMALARQYRDVRGLPPEVVGDAVTRARHANWTLVQLARCQGVRP